MSQVSAPCRVDELGAAAAVQALRRQKILIRGGGNKWKFGLCWLLGFPGNLGVLVVNWFFLGWEKGQKVGGNGADG